jgi:hypothetical protein
VTGTFKANNPYNTFLMLLYAMLLKLPIFLQPKIPTPQLTDGFLYKALLSWVQPFGSSFPVIYPLTTITLLCTQAISFNKIVNELRLMPKPHYLTGMSYLLVTSLFAEWNILSAPLIINTALIWVWARMSSLQNDAKTKATLFNIGIAIGVSTLFYFPAVAFALLVIVGLAITRAFKISEWLIALFGLITPYYFIIAITFLTSNLSKYKFPGVAVSLPKFNQTNWAYAAIIIVVLAATIGLFFVQQNFRRQLIQARKSWNLLFLYLLVAVFVPFINATSTFTYWILAAVPVAALLASTFYYPPKKIVPNVLHWLMVGFVAAISYLVQAN